MWLVKGEARARGGGRGRGEREEGDHNQRAERLEKREMRYLQLSRVFRGSSVLLKKKPFYISSLAYFEPFKGPRAF